MDQVLEEIRRASRRFIPPAGSEIPTISGKYVEHDDSVDACTPKSRTDNGCVLQTA